MLGTHGILLLAPLSRQAIKSALLRLDNGAGAALFEEPLGPGN